jgi:membrane protease YdiL (CAAX protease family)
LVPQPVNDDSSPPQALSEESVPERFDPAEPRFSSLLTGLFAIVLLGCVLLVVWLQFTVPRLERVSSPEKALALTVGRTMELDEAFARASTWQRLLYDLTAGDRQHELAQDIAWYEELAASSRDSLPYLYLAILEAEAGRLDRVHERVKAWDRGKAPFPAFARLLRAGYLEKTLDLEVERALQAELADLLPSGWFYDRLAINLATRAGDREQLSAATDARIERTDPLLQKAASLLAVQGLSILVGTVALLAVVRRWRNREGLRVGTVAMPPSWRGRIGTVVLVRGGAIGGVLMLGLLALDTENLFLRVIAVPSTNLPVLLLAYRYLFGPAGHGLTEGLGLRPFPSSCGRLALIVVAASAAGFLGEWVMDQVAEAAGLSSHWTEWFDSDLVWGGYPVVAVSLLEYVVFAPLFEEMVFRGLLFATLRRKFGWGMSAGISASLFAVAHGYGLLGFVSVFWSGVLWAWVYERTGSLLPGMIAHALNNLIVCLTVIWILRN